MARHRRYRTLLVCVGKPTARSSSPGCNRSQAQLRIRLSTGLQTSTATTSSTIVYFTCQRPRHRPSIQSRQASSTRMAPNGLKYHTHPTFGGARLTTRSPALPVGLTTKMLSTAFRFARRKGTAPFRTNRAYRAYATARKFLTSCPSTTGWSGRCHATPSGLSTAPWTPKPCCTVSRTQPSTISSSQRSTWAVQVQLRRLITPASHTA